MSWLWKWGASLVWGMALLTSLPVLGGGVIVFRQSVRGENQAPINEALAGFREAFRRNWLEATSEREFVNRLGSERPDLVVAVGREAARTARSRGGSYPLLFMMVREPATLGLTGNNVAGVSLDIPAITQFRHFKTLIPKLKVLGVISNPNRSGNLIREAREAAQELDLVLMAPPVHSPKEVPIAFDLISPVLDALWMVPDDTFDDNTDWFQFLAKATVRDQIPFLTTTLGAPLVGQGALAALIPDFREVGRQCGELANAVANGNRPLSEIGIVPPRRVLWKLHTATADRIALRVPPEIRANVTAGD